MRLLLTFFFIGFFHIANGQAPKPEVWVAYSDSITELFGYKDLKGNVKISPRYTFVDTDSFKTIAFVFDKKEGFVAINKEVKILFKPYIFDNGPDEFVSGRIRIEKDKKVGFADIAGNVTIPPIYDLVLPFHGNFTAFYSGGKRICADQDVKEINCEHFEWTGGKWGIINKVNDTIIMPSLTHEELANLNLASLTDKNPGSKSFIKVQGKTKTYYLENVRLAFQDFFRTFLEKVKNRDTAYFSAVTFPNIECTYCLLNTNEERKAMVKAKKYYPGNYYTEDRITEVIPKAIFWDQDLALISSPETLKGLNDTSRTEIFIDLASFASHYRNPKSAFLKELAPQQAYYMVEVVLSHFKRTRKSISYQEHFDFIKTDKGFKFIRYARTLDGYGKDQ